MAYNKIQSAPSLPVPPDDATDYERRLYAALSVYLNAINQVLNDLTDGRLDVAKLNVQFAAPKEPADGWIAYADGTVWNPGTGKGSYEYRSGAWVKL